MTIKEIPLDSWASFLDMVSKQQSEWHLRDAFFSMPRVLFRGHASQTWMLDTTLERDVKYLDDLAKYHDKVHASMPQIEEYSGRKWNVPNVDEFNEAMRNSQPGTFLDNIPALDYLVYLRHHGFPSPLLDWTRSPYIAAYFAFSGVKKIDNGDRISIYELTTSEPLITSRHNNELGYSSYVKNIGHRVQTHKRHFLQQCEYTLCITQHPNGDLKYGNHESALNAATIPVQPLKKYTIPVSERTNALRQLDAFNLNAFTLFTSEDSLVESVGRRVLGY